MTDNSRAIVKRRARALLQLLAVAGVAATLGGCYEQRVTQDTYPNDYRLRHPITLAEGDRTIEVFLSRSRGGLTPAQRADVLSFAQEWRREATSGIIIDVPRGGATEQAAGDSMREIHSILNASGVPRNAVSVRDYRPPGSTLASIKIAYAKLTAQAGPCGRWPTDLGPSGGTAYDENQPYWNLGCATQRNLASMVDNPADLVQPRGETPVYAGRRSVAIDKYRKGENPTATYASDSSNSYDSGKVTGVGK